MLKILPPRMACLPVPDRWTTLPGWNAATARVREDEARKHPPHSKAYLDEMAKAAELERREIAARKSF